MLRNMLIGVACSALLVTESPAQQLFSITSSSDVDALLPVPSEPPFLGRGGYAATNGLAPDGSNSIVVSGTSDGSFSPPGVLLPGNETNGFAIPASALAKSYAFGCSIWLPSGHQLSSASATLTWSADPNGNQILDPTEQWVGITETPPGFGPNLVIVDAW